MSDIQLSESLRREYEKLFNSTIIRAGREVVVNQIIDNFLINKTRYKAVGDYLGVPWWFVAVIHNMEASSNFQKHLHNGDPLSARTVNIPKGRPKTGKPPFTWEDSARDALFMRGLGSKTDWSLAGSLYQLERYNGWGYRLYHKHVLSPYLWSFSNHYKSGKYIADGTWSDTAVSKQCGSAVLLRRLAEIGLIGFKDQLVPEQNAIPLVVNYSTHKSKDASFVQRAEELQQWLNTFPGIFVKVDGIPGPRTSDAYKMVTGVYLPGDQRAQL